MTLLSNTFEKHIVCSSLPPSRCASACEKLREVLPERMLLNFISPSILQNYLTKNAFLSPDHLAKVAFQEI